MITRSNVHAPDTVGSALPTHHTLPTALEGGAVNIIVPTADKMRKLSPDKVPAVIETEVRFKLALVPADGGAAVLRKNLRAMKGLPSPLTSY